MKINIHLICAARPNFMKIAPLYHALKEERWANPVIIHTGQHYDVNMSDTFFRDLNLPAPHFHLGVGSGSHAEQTGQVMIAYEKVLMKEQPDMVIVVGDVNSTMACSIAASKVIYPHNLKFKIQNSKLPVSRPFIAHLEAGLRSFDRTMPEEINRVVTDSLADSLWIPSPDAEENLIREGISLEKIQFVGNIMIDSLEMLRAKIEKLEVYKEFNLKKKEYGLITLHRPSNVDDVQVLEDLSKKLIDISDKISLIFPVHPRTLKNLEHNNLLPLIMNTSNMLLTEPLNYISFMNLVFNCRFVITDSGGIQEETTYLGIPCLTIRPNTERPITVTHGTNQLCEYLELEEKLDDILSNSNKERPEIKFWDGKTAQRIAKLLKGLVYS